MLIIRLLFTECFWEKSSFSFRIPACRTISAFGQWQNTFFFQASWYLWLSPLWGWQCSVGGLCPPLSRVCLIYSGQSEKGHLSPITACAWTLEYSSVGFELDICLVNNCSNSEIRSLPGTNQIRSLSGIYSCYRFNSFHTHIRRKSSGWLR